MHDSRGIATRSLVRLPLGIIAIGAIVITGTIHTYLRTQAAHIAVFGPFSADGVEDRLLPGREPLAIMLQHHTPQLLLMPAAVVWWSLFMAPVALIVLVALTRGWQDFLRLLLLHVTLLFSADVVFALFPTQPPWMRDGVPRLLAGVAGGVISVDPNPQASVPSLHVGVLAMFAIWLCCHSDPRLRVIGRVLALWSLAMVWAVVYTGEHYLLGALAGIAWAAIVYGCADRLGLAQSREYVALRPIEQPQAAAHAREPLPDFEPEASPAAAA